MRKCLIFKKQNGFTLIELLVVVGIIVILAALIIVNITQARMNGRDAKRIADVASIQLALEMYNNANGQYPEDQTGWAAAAGKDSPAHTTCQNAWNTLSGELTNYLSPLPKDPLNKAGGYRYYVDIRDDPDDPNPTGAIIKTKLEANPEKMKEDSCQGDYNNPDYYDVITGYMPDGEDGGENRCNGSTPSLPSSGYPDREC